MLAKFDPEAQKKMTPKKAAQVKERVEKKVAGIEKKVATN